MRRKYPAEQPTTWASSTAGSQASIRETASGEASVPDFDHAVGLHRLIDAIRQSSDEGRRVAVA